MITFNLTPHHQKIKEYAHLVAEKELRSRSLECDQSASIPNEFFTAMQQKAHGMSFGYLRPSQFPEEIRAEDDNQKSFLGVLISEEWGWGDPALASAIPGIGLAGPTVLAFGTPEQKNRILAIYEDASPHWGALALTEPGAGSDVSSIRTTAQLEGNEYVINGTKHFITNGARADIVVVFATIDPSLGHLGIRPFAVQKGTPGLTPAHIEHKMGLRASQTAELVLDHCHVPAENLLGGPGMNKAGFRAAMGTLDSTRPLVASLAVGLARSSLELSQQIISNLPQQSQPRYREQVEDFDLEIQSARLLVWRAAWLADQQQPYSKEASMAKAYAAQVAKKVTAFGQQLAGIYSDAPEYDLLLRMYRDAPVFDIFEGTGQIQRLIISRRMAEEMKGV